MRVQWLNGHDVCRLCEDINIRVLGVLYTIPKGFEWNGASIPSIFWSILFVTPFHHTVRRASLVHDYLYTQDVYRPLADVVFLKLMKQDGCNWAQRSVMYLAVRLFGWAFYGGGKNGE